MRRYTTTIQEIDASNTDTVGGKGASLGELQSAGVTVPEGFIVTTTAFTEFIDVADLRPEIELQMAKVDPDVPHTLDQASEAIHYAIENATIPQTIVDEVWEAYSELNAEYVAVRSSAVAEDGASAAWAGQLDTFLNTTKDQLIEHIQKCWASFFSPRALFYRVETGQHDALDMAVVIQRMVQSEKAGIAFSVHPVTQNSNQLIIESSYGLGEAVVSGQVTPDSFVIEKDSGEIIETYIPQKERQLSYSPASKTNEWSTVSKELQDAESLSSSELSELATQVIQIEEHYGKPMDIEWAIADNTLYITQARPITTLNTPPEDKGEYIFMWSTTPITPTYWATACTFRDDKSMYPQSDVFQFFDGEIITAYMRSSDLDQYKREESVKYLDENFYQEYVKKYENEYANWWKWIRNIEQTDYSEVAPEKLAEDAQQFFDYQRDSIAYFGSTRPEFTYSAEQSLEKLVKKYVSEKWTTPFSVLTSATVMDDVQKEEHAWNALAKENPADQDLLEHASEYPWLVFGQYDDEGVVDYLRQRLETGEVHDGEFNKQELIDEQKGLIQQCNEASSEAEYLGRFLQEQSVRRMDIKAYWAGSFYLSRNLWKAVQKHTGIAINDFLSYLAPPEIIQLIQGELDNVDNLINERKKGYAFYYVAGEPEIQILEADEAKQLYNQFIASQHHENDSMLEGQIASVGSYTGKARRVIAGNLEMLKQSIQDFEEGEILVTSMTQPNMMPIARKAGAILADEGGITSHAAIIARELGVPCIVGCLRAMEVIQDGETVVVDASGENGKVFIVEE